MFLASVVSFMVSSVFRLPLSCAACRGLLGFSFGPTTSLVLSLWPSVVLIVICNLICVNLYYARGDLNVQLKLNLSGYCIYDKSHARYASAVRCKLISERM